MEPIAPTLLKARTGNRAIPVPQDTCALDKMPQFANIASPRLGRKPFFGHFVECNSEPAELLQEMPRQKHGIPSTGTQWRKFDWKNR